MYTAFEVDESFRRDAGFTDSYVGVGNLVAIEFANTPFDEVLYYVDFCDSCLGENRDDIVERANARSREPSGTLELDVTGDGSYLNTDVDASYRLSIDGSTANVQGQIFRFYWEEIANREEALIAQSVQFVPLDELRDRIASQNDLDRDRLMQGIALLKQDIARERAKQAPDTSRIVWMEDDLKYLEYELIDLQERDSADDLALHERAFFLFETLALFRHFKDHSSPREWNEFMETVRSYAETAPQPWIRYTESYRSVY